MDSPDKDRENQKRTLAALLGLTKRAASPNEYFSIAALEREFYRTYPSHQRPSISRVQQYLESYFANGFVKSVVIKGTVKSARVGYRADLEKETQITRELRGNLSFPDLSDFPGAIGHGGTTGNAPVIV